MLISTALLSLVLLGLYGAFNMQQRSNQHLRGFLTRALEADRSVMVLYRDILQCDGNITLQSGEFDRLCLNQTSHSLHGLREAKVCWVVAKEGNVLLRIEGNGYRLPLRSSDGVEVDEVMKPMELFDVQKDKHNILVALKRTGQKPFVFLVQGVEAPPKISSRTRRGSGKSGNQRRGNALPGSRTNRP
jgi:type II secretory pathway component PulJ